MSKSAVGAISLILSALVCSPARAEGELGGLKGIGGMGGGFKGIGGMGGGFKGIGGMGGGCKGVGGMGGGFRGVGDAGGGFDSARSNYCNRYNSNGMSNTFGSAFSDSYSNSMGRYDSWRCGSVESYRSPVASAASLQVLHQLRMHRLNSVYYGAQNQDAAYFGSGSVLQTARRARSYELPPIGTRMVSNPDSMGGFRIYSENP